MKKSQNLLIKRVEELEYALKMNPEMPTVFTDIDERLRQLEISQNTVWSQVMIELESFWNDKSTTEFEVKAMKAHVDRIETHTLSLNT